MASILWIHIVIHERMLVNMNDLITKSSHLQIFKSKSANSFIKFQPPHFFLIQYRNDLTNTVSCFL